MFWKIIDSASRNEAQSFCKNVVAILTEQPQDLIYEFQLEFMKHMKLLCNRNTLGVLVLMDEMAGDNHFDDFRSWVISKGKIFFDIFLQNPDILAPVLFEETQKRGYAPMLQCLQLAATLAIFEKNGRVEMIHAGTKWAEQGYNYGDAIFHLNSPTFTDEELEKNYPILWQYFNRK